MLVCRGWNPHLILGLTGVIWLRMSHTGSLSFQLVALFWGRGAALLEEEQLFEGQKEAYKNTNSTPSEWLQVT